MERVLALITLQDGQGLHAMDIDKKALGELSKGLNELLDVNNLSEDLPANARPYACLDAIESFISGKNNSIPAHELKGRYFSRGS